MHNLFYGLGIGVIVTTLIANQTNFSNTSGIIVGGILIAIGFYMHNMKKKK